ncbi:DUF397 domain-containing protein [Saccharopolyspora rosea]|uniref:DUF397 domain-containing protein n=1 Tax=Saccharopolyspora rosea TaxID=524884 RepID=A0ABW3FRZ2_9PSEU
MDPQRGPGGLRRGRDRTWLRRVRDSKDRGGSVLTFSRSQWAEFVTLLREQS